ncbi:hypothetical protein BDW74DRAFT_173889 [Aspergillus multicolor]|uniref:uncharacterized protein n=1 Tax=Aspergillus multicolor TaxID=41759 RepID=UPI003CCD638A
MVRRNTYCTSELPSAVRDLDAFFGIGRSHPSLPEPPDSPISWTPPLRRTCSVGKMTSSDFGPELDDIVDELVLPQVDGTGARRKAKKRRNVARKKKDKEMEQRPAEEVDEVEDSQNETADGVTVQVEELVGSTGNGLEDSPDGDRDAAATRPQPSEGPGMSRVNGVFIVHGDRGVKASTPNPEPELEFAHEMELEAPQQPEQAHEQQEQEQEQDQEDEQLHLQDNLVCHIHYRPLCQFNPVCCYHKPSIGCGCPPRWSCCCIHHAGDCCYCQGQSAAEDPEPELQPDLEPEPEEVAIEDIAIDEQVIIEEVDGSKTLSVAFCSSPTTPPDSEPEPLPESQRVSDFLSDPPPPPQPEHNTTTTTTTTTTFTASASTPEKPSGVEVVVTPPSPILDKTTEPLLPLESDEDQETTPDMAASQLSSELIAMMECGHMSDLKITLHSAHNEFWKVTMTAHKCILARSPLITNILKNDPNCVEIQVYAGEQFNMLKAWEQAVHHIYGRELLDLDTLKPTTLGGLGYDPFPGYDAEYPFSLRLAMVEMALGYAASGAFFYSTSLADRGFRLALELMDWETLEQILVFGLRTEQFCVTLPNLPWLKKSASDSDKSQGDAAKATESKAAKGNSKSTSPSDSNTASLDYEMMAIAEPPYPIGLLQADWSRRIIASALSFLADNVKSDFKLYSSAESKVLPERIPEFLKTAPKTPVSATPATPTTPVKEKSSQSAPAAVASPVTTPPSAPTPSDPRLANMQFGSLPSLNQRNLEEMERKAREQSASRHTPDTPTPRGRTSIPPVVDGIGEEILVPSAVFLSLPFHELKFTFSMMSGRGVMTQAIAKAIVDEREARRRQALKNYAAHLLAANTKRKGDTVTVFTGVARPGEGASAGAVTLTNTTAAPITTVKQGRPKGKARKAAKKAKEAGEGNVSSKEAQTEQATAIVVHLPPDLKDLCYREFYTSNFVGGGGDWADDQGYTMDIEVALDREWAGFEY